MPVLADEAIVLVAGARAAAVHDVLTALLPGRRRLPYPPRSTYVVFHGASTAATASFSCLASVGTGLPRPLRRVELTLTDPLLERVTLVGVRVTPTDRGHAHAALVEDLVRQCESVIVVTDGRAPYQPAEIDLLRYARDFGKGVFFAVTHTDEGSSWPDVVRRNQTTLARHLPELAMLPWHPVSRSRTSVLELRDSVLAWSRSQRRPPVRRASAIRIAPGAAETNWRDVLRIEVERAHHRAEVCVDRELVHLRAMIAKSALDVEAFDARLRALSLTLAAQASLAVEFAIGTVLAQVLLNPPDAAVLRRVVVALQRDVAERCCGATTCVRALRVTGTAAAAIATARDAIGAQAGLPDSTNHVLPPLSIGLTANCLRMKRTGDPDDQRDWLTRAVGSLALELDRELSRQFTYLGQAAADLITDGLDHDLLLV